MSRIMISCKTCGHEIDKDAKACPQCGAKNKKPFFKKWWFWVAVILAVIMIGNTDAENQNGDSNHDSGEVSVTENINESGTVAKETTTTTKTAETTDAATAETEITIQMTMAQKNALASAKNYLRFAAFSYEGLIEQLEYEKYAKEDATFAADNCGAEWYEQALKSAENYLDFAAFSYKGLIEQLEFEKFTTEEAVYAADNCGADWFEQAAKSAENYLEFMSFSRDGLIEQLEYEGFTKEQAEYGAKANGYE